MSESTIRSQLELVISDILFNMGKEIKILKIDNDNIILDVPYTEYINQILIAVDNYTESIKK